MQRRHRMDLFGASLLIGFSALLGLNQALVKLVNAGFAPVFQGGLRSACAFGVVVWWILLRGKRLDFRRGTVMLGVFNGLLFAMEFAFLFLALDLSSVARCSLLFYTMPFFVALGAHWLFPGEHLTLAKSGGLALAVVGVALVVMTDPGESRETAWLGDLFALAAAMCWAGLTLLTRATRLAELSPAQNLLYHLAVSGVVLLVVSPLFGDTIRDVTLPIVAIFAFQVIVVVSLGFIVWLWVLSVYPVSNMASFSLLTPLFGVFFGWLVFDEHLSATFMLGLLAVCCGLLLINRRPAPRPSATAID